MLVLLFRMATISDLRPGVSKEEEGLEVMEITTDLKFRRCLLWVESIVGPPKPRHHPVSPPRLHSPTHRPILEQQRGWQCSSSPEAGTR